MKKEKNTKTTAQEILENFTKDTLDIEGIVGKTPKDNNNSQQGQKPKADEGDQSENTPEISDDDIALLLEAGLTEQELTAKSVEEIQQLIEEKKRGQQKPSPLTITQDIAEQLGGIAKSFVGKDVTELFKALDEQNSYIGKLSARLKQLETELNSKSQTQNVEVKGKSKEELLGMLQADELEKVVEKVLSKRLPNIEKLKEVAIQEQQQIILNNIQSQLGNNYNAQEVVKQFTEEVGITDEDIAYYEAKPQRFIRDVVDYVKRQELAKELEEIKKKKSYEQKLEIARKIRQALKSKTANVNVSDENADILKPKAENQTVREILEKL